MRNSGHPTSNGASTSRRYDLVKDPVFYITFAFFALLTTALPAALGQPNFLPIAQTVALTLFLAIPLRRGKTGTGIMMLSLWLSLQFMVMLVGSALLPVVFQRAIHDGFDFHRALLEWSATGSSLPGSLHENAGPRVVELFGVLLGSLVSAGLIGIWFLMRTLNQFAFAAGRLAAEGPSGLMLGLMPWRIAMIAGYAGSIALLAQPLLRNTWSPFFYLARQRRLAAVSILLLAAGLVTELALPGLWRVLWAP